MKIETFINQLETTIEGVPAGSLRPNTELHGLPQWDSLAILTVLAMVDAEYGVQVSGLEIQQCRTVHDLFTVVSSKQKPGS